MKNVTHTSPGHLVEFNQSVRDFKTPEVHMHQTFSQLSVGVTTEAETMVAEAAAPPVVVEEAAAPNISLLLACLVGDI